MGSGFVESVYQECLEIELTLRGIPFQAQQELKLSYKGEALQHTYIPDLFCYDKIILELKAVSSLNDVHRAQLLNYLKASGHSLGFLINFGSSPKATIERMINTPR